MLNRSTQIENSAALMVDITGYTTWRCRRGHVTQVWLKFNGNSAYSTNGGSSWDFCDQCSQRPNVIQDTKAHLVIFSQWLDEELITLNQYRKLANAIVSTAFSPAIDAWPVGLLGLPNWQQFQNQKKSMPA